MRVAYHLINFGVWKNKSDDEKMQAVKQAGYMGVEGVRIDYSADPAVFKARLLKTGLLLAAQNMPGPLMGTDDQRLTELAHEQVRFGGVIGCSVVMTAAPRTDGHKIHTYGTAADHYQEAARRLNLVGRILADNGMKLAIHNHIDHMTESWEEMEILMNETNGDWVGICFDTAHAVCGGVDPVKYARHFRTRIRHLHLKDTKNLLHGRPYFFKNVFLPLGKGVIDFPAVMKALETYEGWVTVELDSTFSCGNPVEEAGISLMYCQKNWKNWGQPRR